ncbi:hypothetical protein GCM10009127_09690 [Alteraurantiacibacter aestuarii]|uniref:DUF8021 domain-containing protein n=1 Tax=Alteraurantiacibacter aestuarii TaxID=650004 RepID=A0A844ZHU8_9SPHN|nr:hypothetical protein [Alteraurantiacibacter aestuarii]MXO87358.1 hypothetical protein [Alteraurantiacibacter aestuarii]
MRKTLTFAGSLLLATALTACGETATEEAAPVCDRACLIDLTANYVAGIEGNNAEGITFADEAKIVENLHRIHAGEGLWADTTGAGTDFGVTVPDEINQTAGWLGMIERAGVPTVVAIRLKLDDQGKIAEAEHLYAEVPADRAEERLTTPRPGLLAEVPADARMDHDALITLGASYYDALDDNDGTLMPFSADCQRHENGMVTAGADAGAGPNNNTSPIARDCAGQLSSNVMAYITRIDNRRVFAADPVTGLVMGLSHFRHPMDFEPYEVTALDGSKIMYDTARLPFDPFDLPAAHIFKVGADGMVHEIEAMGFRADLNAATGWEDDAAAPAEGASGE